MRKARIVRHVAAMVIAASAFAVPAARALPSVTYVVAPWGNDAAPGTGDAPFATIRHAIESLRVGDTLLVRGGVYDERIMNPSIATGAVGAPITVAAWPGERPVIRGLLWMRGANFWMFDGLNVTWSAANNASEHMVKFTDGLGWQFIDAEVWGAHSYAGMLIAGNASDWAVRHVYLHDTYATHGTNQDHLLYVNAAGGGIVEDCVLAHSANGQAIKVGAPSREAAPVGTVLIRNNTMVDNRGPSNVQLDWAASGVVLNRNILVGAARGRTNVTAYEVFGTANAAVDNIGWDSVGVADTEFPGLVTAANQMIDPGFVDPAAGDFHTTNPAVAGYGATLIG